MRQSFPLFTTPIDLAHSFWQSLIQNGDAFIDATCGNGKDSLFLAKLAASKKDTHLYCIDIQKQALDKAKLLLEAETTCITWIHGSHEQLPPTAPKNCRLIVYNLGYLPGGDKSVTTLTSSTLKSVSHALELLCLGGVISITCYPGHEEGKKEEEKLSSFFSLLDPKKWCFTHFHFDNRKESPSLMLIQKSCLS